MCQGAAGFANSSKWASGIGAFMNLESTGSGGPAVVFQATGKHSPYAVTPDLGAQQQQRSKEQTLQ